MKWSKKKERKKERKKEKRNSPVKVLCLEKED